MSVKQQFQSSSRSNALIDALRALLEAPTTDEMHSVLVRRQSLLVTEAAYNLLKALWEEEWDENPNENVYGPGYIQIHQTLLMACRALGVAKGWQDWSSKMIGMASREAVREHYQTGAFNRNILWKQDAPSNRWAPSVPADGWLEALAKVALVSVVSACKQPGEPYSGLVNRFVSTTVEYRPSSRDFSIHRSPGSTQVAGDSERAMMMLLRSWHEELIGMEQRNIEQFCRATYFITGPLLALVESALSR